VCKTAKDGCVPETDLSGGCEGQDQGGPGAKLLYSASSSADSALSQGCPSLAPWWETIGQSWKWKVGRG
jgi:hypothetical protein